MSDFIADYKEMAKPGEIEEIWDLYMIRPAGFLLVQLFRCARITPNMVSVLSVLAAWLCAYYLYETCKVGNDFQLSIWAAFAMFAHSALDSADGQLARVTGQGSSVGRTIDGFCDNLSFLGIYIAIFFGYFDYVGEIPIEILLIGVLAGVSHSFQTSMTDFQRCLFLYYVYNKIDIENESKDSFKKKLRTKLSLFHRFLIYLHLNYIKIQHTFCKSSETLKQQIESLRKNNLVTHKDVSIVYSKFQTGMLKGWALLGSNSHKIGIIVASFLPVGMGSFFGELGLVWFWIYELVFLNICMMILLIAQKRIDRKIYTTLQAKQIK